MFITSDAQLLHFPASVGAAAGPGRRRDGGHPAGRASHGDLVRRGRPGRGGPGRRRREGPARRAGRRHRGRRGGSAARHRAATVKVTPYAEYPAKGRATGGVRCHRFLKGEDVLVLAWAGPGPARGATEAGIPVDLPPPIGRRDGSGERVASRISRPSAAPTPPG